MKQAYSKQKMLAGRSYLQLLIIFSFSNNNGLARSLLYGISGIIDDIGLFSYVAYAGTTLTLRHAESMQSTGGRDRIVEPYLNFHYNTINSAREYLSRTLNLDDCKEVLSNDNLMRKLEGRPRLVSRVVMRIQDVQPSLSKADVLSDAINESFTQHIKTISEGLLNRAKASKEVRQDEIKHALIVMALAISLDEKLAFRADRDVDFVNARICHLQKDTQSDDLYFLLGEPLSRAIVSAILISIGTSITDVVSAQYVNLLASSVLNPQEKGKFLEKIIATALLEKDAMRLQLSFQQNFRIFLCKQIGQKKWNLHV
jgi:hypothetical protein